MSVLEHRPDVVAARRGIGRAQNELGLQRANRLDDVFFFYDPLTYQDNSPSKLKIARSWVIAMTVPLPIYNRNQGNIAKAHSNLHQTQVELAALERRVVSEVRIADASTATPRSRSRGSKNNPGERSKSPPAKHPGLSRGKITPDDYLGSSRGRGRSRRQLSRCPDSSPAKHDRPEDRRGRPRLALSTGDIAGRPTMRYAESGDSRRS